MTIPPTSPSVPYSKARSQLGTGDLVFLHGTSAAGVMIEQLEQDAGWPPYSHIGMVIKDGDSLFMWDAPGGGDCFPDPYASDPDNRIYGAPGPHRVSRVGAGRRPRLLRDEGRRAGVLGSSAHVGRVRGSVRGLAQIHQSGRRSERCSSWAGTGRRKRHPLPP